MTVLNLAAAGWPDCIDRMRENCRQYDPAAVRDCRLRLPEEAILAGRSPVHFWQTVARDFRIYKTERDES